VGEGVCQRGEGQGSGVRWGTEMGAQRVGVEDGWVKLGCVCNRRFRIQNKMFGFTR